MPQESDLVNKINENFSGVDMETIFEGIGNAKWMIFASIILAFISSFLFSFFLETCAGIVVTITIIGYFAGMGFATYFTFKKKNYHKDIYDKDNTEKVAHKLYKFFNLIFWICVTLLSISVCMLLCFFSRIVLAVKVIKVNSKNL